MRALLLASLIALMTLPALAQESKWRTLDENELGGFTYSWRPDSLRRRGENLRVWTRYVESESEPTIAQIQELDEIDCKLRLVRTVTSIGYYRDRGTLP